MTDDVALEDLGDGVRLSYVENVRPIDGGTFSRAARALLEASEKHLDAEEFHPEVVDYLRCRAVEYDRLAVRAGRMPCTPKGARYARRRRRAARKGRRGFA